MGMMEGQKRSLTARSHMALGDPASPCGVPPPGLSTSSSHPHWGPEALTSQFGEAFGDLLAVLVTATAGVWGGWVQERAQRGQGSAKDASAQCGWTEDLRVEGGGEDEDAVVRVRVRA